MARDHRKLRAFELADELAIAVYELTQVMPRDERFGLTSQMRRAAVSVPTNIVEGCGRMTQKEYLNFLNIALASARELDYLISLSKRLGFLEPEASRNARRLCDETCRVTTGLTHAIRKATT